MRNLKSGFILSYISIFIQSIISILYTPVMLRLLGESNYGLLQLAISTMSSLSILSFGFGSSYMRFYSQYKADNDNNAISVLNGMFTIIFISVSILSLIVGGFITMNTSTLFGKSMTASEIKLLKTLLGIMTVNLAFTFPCSISDSYIIAQERFSFQKILIIISSLLNPMLTFPLLIMGQGAVSVAICMTAITVIKLLCGTVYCIKKLNMRFCFAFDKNVFKQLSVFSFFVFLNIISDQINWNVDKILLGMFSGAKNVAVYSVGSQFNGYFLTFSYALSSLMTPKAHTLIANHADNRETSKFFASFGRLQFVVMAYIYLMIIAVGKPFIKLWSGIDSNIPYYTALLLISPLVITSIQSIGIEIQRAKDMHKFRSVLYFAIAAINIAVSIPLCIKFGELGCAFGTALILVVGNIIIMNIYYHKRVGLDIKYFWKEIFKFIPSLIIPILTIIVIRHFVSDNLFSIALCGIIFTVFYAVSMWFLGLNKNEKSYIKKM